MDRFFEDGLVRPWRLLSPTAEYEATFPIEVSETEHDVEVKAALPGIRPEDVDISIVNDVLTIKAEHKEEHEDKKREYYRRELRYGAFHRGLSLPISVDADKAEARFENGVLHLRLPKAEALRPKQIKITGNGGNVEHTS
jgi:HSP20 family protein